MPFGSELRCPWPPNLAPLVPNYGSLGSLILDLLIAIKTLLASKLVTHWIAIKAPLAPNWCPLVFNYGALGPLIGASFVRNYGALGPLNP